jgi:ribose 1,5-bisphosphokinase PhnN
MLSNILREKNFNDNARQLSHAVRHKAHGHAFGLRVKAMLLAQCKLFYVKDY